MPAIAESTSKKKKKQSGKAAPLEAKKLLKEYSLIALAGAALGLSAPGINQWYTAWFCVAPLVISIATSAGIRHAFLRGLVFGTAFNLVYGNWMLGLQPLDWLGFSWWQGWLLASTALLIVSLHQGLITALFAGFCRLIPLTGGYLPKKVGNGFALPTLLVIPTLWVLMHNFVGNAHDALGIPWTMLEYTQWKQHYFVQVASLIGGIGISFLIVLWNTSLASLAVAFFKTKNAKMLTVSSTEHAYYQQLLSAVILIAFTGAGLYYQSQNRVRATQSCSVLQGNINIDMQKTTHRYQVSDLWDRYAALARFAPPGVCVWSEGSLPVYLRSEPSVQRQLSQLSKQRKLSMVVGSIDNDSLGHPYNAAYGFSDNGEMFSEIYHKRYLVPFGEYAPAFINYMPSWVRKLTNTPAGAGYTSGKQPVVFNFDNAAVSPLICFEVLSPEMVASSVRAGGRVLVNVSDLAWFHGSMVGDQMLAFASIRAIENRRYFIFAANTGPRRSSMQVVTLPNCRVSIKPKSLPEKSA